MQRCSCASAVLAALTEAPRFSGLSAQLQPCSLDSTALIVLKRAAAFALTRGIAHNLFKRAFASAVNDSTALILVKRAAGPALTDSTARILFKRAVGAALTDSTALIVFKRAPFRA